MKYDGQPPCYKACSFFVPFIFCSFFVLFVFEGREVGENGSVIDQVARTLAELPDLVTLLSHQAESPGRVTWTSHLAYSPDLVNHDYFFYLYRIS
jgi:hypothetical protein